MRLLRCVLFATLWVVLPPLALPASAWTFVDATASAGLGGLVHGFLHGPFGREVMSGGVAAGDLDGDGGADLVVLRGDLAPPAVFRNDGGVFVHVTDLTMVPRDPDLGLAPNGVLLADLDGDGDLDIVMGGVLGAKPRLLRNDGGFVFADATPPAWLAIPRDTWSVSAGDFDGDGRLDLFLAHWMPGTTGGGEHLWRNEGGLAFSDAGGAAGVDAPFQGAAGDHTFTASFVDLDHDGHQDLVVAVDFGNSRVFRNRGDGTFEDLTDGGVITDENGMGLAVGDVDGDLDLDWFVSSVWDPDGVQTPGGNWGVTGNRLYRNECDPGPDGACTSALAFTDGTDTAGVRHGWWGWAACLEDFDLDGDLDLFQVNGFPMGDPEFDADPSVLFLNQGGGVFVEAGAALQVADTIHGRGIACFDADGDGDIDLLVSNWNAPARYYRNDLAPGSSWTRVRLRGDPPNTWGIGARVYLTAGGTTQLRAVHAGSHFLSASPPEAHFGLGAAGEVERLRVVWPGGGESVAAGLAANAVIEIPEALLFSAGFEAGLGWSQAFPP